MIWLALVIAVVGGRFTLRSESVLKIWIWGVGSFGLAGYLLGLGLTRFLQS